MYSNPELSREVIDYVFTNHPRIFRDMVKASIICEMRLGGVSFKEIGIEVGLTPARVKEYVDKVCRLYGVYLRRLGREKKQRLVDRIKEMSVTELAEFLSSDASINRQAEKYSCNKCKKAHNGICPADDEECVIGKWTEAELIREWLLQEVSDS